MRNEGSELATVPFAPGPLSDVSPEYRQRLAECPFSRVRLRSGHEAVLIVSYEDAVAAMADVRLTHDLTAPGSPRLVSGPSFRDDPDFILNTDGEGHRRIRRIIASAFTAQSVERWKPLIQAVTDELIDDIERHGSPSDLVKSYATPLPVRVIGGMLGVPKEDTARFARWSDAFALAAEMSDEEREGTMAEFGQYISDLVASRRAKPEASLIDDLIAARDGADRLSEVELTRLVTALIVGGTHTSSNAFGRALLTLLRDDGILWKKLVADPSLIPAATDEVFRLCGMGDVLNLRVATEDVKLSSGMIRKGEAVIIATYPALRDGSVFKEPDSVRFDRNHKGRHLVFGGGPHYCPGASLAKAEFQIGLASLVKRLPSLQLAAELGALRFTEGEELSSLESLPVSWPALEQVTTP